MATGLWPCSSKANAVEFESYAEVFSSVSQSSDWSRPHRFGAISTHGELELFCCVTSNLRNLELLLIEAGDRISRVVRRFYLNRPHLAALCSRPKGLFSCWAGCNLGCVWLRPEASAWEVVTCLYDEKHLTSVCKQIAILVTSGWQPLHPPW